MPRRSDDTGAWLLLGLAAVAFGLFLTERGSPLVGAVSLFVFVEGLMLDHRRWRTSSLSMVLVAIPCLLSQLGLLQGHALRVAAALVVISTAIRVATYLVLLVHLRRPARLGVPHRTARRAF